MIVNHAVTRGPIERDLIDLDTLQLETLALDSAGLSEAPGGAGFALALRSSGRLAEIGDASAAAADPELPAHDEGERVRLERKGRMLLAHCLEQSSRVCITGFLEHELARAPAGRRFTIEFMALLMTERIETGDLQERGLIDGMIAEGLELILGLEPGMIDDD